uniref:non-specific serine/threonine protein kinase n=1 Tax=Saccharum hybrid cultivar R570 TaxID=131158 RepID=A0A059Q051_9POAL|nr:hypothetical protein SHCRBa_201_A23_F_60 [Saccharum hybrid cultivar R570]
MGPLKADIQSINAINKIDLSSNRLLGGLPDSFGQLQMLTYLNLSHNSFQGSIPNSLGKLASMETLDLSYNNLSGNIPLYLANFTYLTNLNLSFNKLHGRIPEGGGIFSNISLQSLLRDNGLCGAPRLGFSSCTVRSYSTNGQILKFVLPGALAAFGAIAICLYLIIRRKSNNPGALTGSNNITDAISHSLDTHLHNEDKPPLKFLKRLDIMIEVSMAVEHLHYRHHEVILHYDLKPSNVLFDDNMTAHVADFGIARLLLGENNSVISASMPGTIGYMAPEYGSMGKASRKSDVFSFGIMLLEVFTGKKPTDTMFVGELSLRRWVHQAFPSRISHILDGNVQKDDEIVHGFHHTSNPSEVSPSISHSTLTSVFELGMICTSELPDERITMTDVVAKLTKIKDDFKLEPSSTGGGSNITSVAVKDSYNHDKVEVEHSKVLSSRSCEQRQAPFFLSQKLFCLHGYKLQQMTSLWLLSSNNQPVVYNVVVTNKGVQCPDGAPI